MSALFSQNMMMRTVVLINRKYQKQWLQKFHLSTTGQQPQLKGIREKNYRMMRKRMKVLERRVTMMRITGGKWKRYTYSASN
jgi:hypothetical protein